MLKKCEAMGPRGLGAASGGGSGSIWRTETARLLSVNFNTSSGLDSSPWVLDGWAEIQQWQVCIQMLYFHCGEMITMCNTGLSVGRFSYRQALHQQISLIFISTTTDKALLSSQTSHC